MSRAKVVSARLTWTWPTHSCTFSFQPPAGVCFWCHTIVSFSRKVFFINKVENMHTMDGCSQCSLGLLNALAWTIPHPKVNCWLFGDRKAHVHCSERNFCSFVVPLVIGSFERFSPASSEPVLDGDNSIHQGGMLQLLMLLLLLLLFIIHVCVCGNPHSLQVWCGFCGCLYIQCIDYCYCCCCCFRSVVSSGSTLSSTLNQTPHSTWQCTYKTLSCCWYIDSLDK